MNNDLVIQTGEGGITIAWLQNSRLIELHKEEQEVKVHVGDMYLARIKKILPGLNSVFVEIGTDKPAFLHYHDLGPNVRSLLKYINLVQSGKYKTSQLRNFNFEPQIIKTGKIAEVFSNNDMHLVQVVKEPISTKGPRVSSELALAGRYIVMVPFSNIISISKKIANPEERNRLKTLINSVRPHNFGIIVRTAAENKKVAEIDNDIRDLIEKWKICFDQILKSKPPTKVLGEISKSTSLIRDILNPTFNNIYIDDERVALDIRNYIKTISPDQEKIVKVHSKKIPIFDFFGIDKQIKSCFGKTVTIPGGAYLIIEHTEAMYVIDVNSGTRGKVGGNQEDNALKVNMEAASEIARQVRLRDIGGLIVIDFIDMYLASNRRKLFLHLKDIMQEDRAKHVILPPSKFGLVQITRQRVKPATELHVAEPCPTCRGTGEINASSAVIEEIEKNLKFILTELNESRITIHVHPFIEAYLTKGFKSIHKKWCLQHLTWLRIKSEKNYSFLEYHFYNSQGVEIKI